ncbi:MAG: hypothetical protein WED04_09650 [Promethearchaeati archaeon SRVP18_Atabeyarchaeia-1]
MVEANLVNVVATAELKQNVDLDKIGDLKYGLHDDMYYGGRVAYLKAPAMKGRVTIFSSGKMISVGTRSSREATSDLESAIHILAEAGLAKFVPISMRVRNAVATVDFGRTLDLNELAKKSGEVVYEPEQFPGAICKLAELPEITVLLFASGKAVITEIRDPDHLDAIVGEILRFLDARH